LLLYRGIQTIADMKRDTQMLIYGGRNMVAYIQKDKKDYYCTERQTNANIQINRHIWW